MDIEKRKQKRLAHAQRGILEAARTVFAREGVEASIMQQIAEEAGYGTSSLYNYFASKTDIVNAVLDDMMTLAMKHFDRPQKPDEDFHTYFRSIITEQIEFGSKHQEYFFVMVNLRGPGAKDTGILPEHSDQYMDKLAEIMESGMDQGAFQRMDAAVAAHLVQGALRSLMFLPQASQDAPTMEALLTNYFDFIFRGLSPD